jgi:rsbT co-antagonist protein RsbR
VTVRYLELTDTDRATLAQLGAALEPHFDDLLAETLAMYADYDELGGLLPAESLVGAVRSDLERYIRTLQDGQFDAYLREVEHRIYQRTEEGLTYDALVVAIQGRQQAAGRVLRQVGVTEEELAVSRRSLQRFGQMYLARAAQAYLDAKEATIRSQQEAILALSTPVVEVWDGVLALPIVGTIDTARARQITQGLLRAVRETQARCVIMDITGVPLVDTQVANHLLHTLRAARLLGTHGLLVGISPEIADTLVSLGIGFDDIETYFSMRQGLQAALARLNVNGSKKTPAAIGSPASPAITRRDRSR